MAAIVLMFCDLCAQDELDEFEKLALRDGNQSVALSAL